jgi:hypothetical protein
VRVILVQILRCFKLVWIHHQLAAIRLIFLLSIYVFTCS